MRIQELQYSPTKKCGEVHDRVGCVRGGEGASRDPALSGGMWIISRTVSRREIYNVLLTNRASPDRASCYVFC